MVAFLCCGGHGNALAVAFDSHRSPSMRSSRASLVHQPSKADLSPAVGDSVPGAFGRPQPTSEPAASASDAS